MRSFLITRLILIENQNANLVHQKNHREAG